MSTTPDASLSCLRALGSAYRGDWSDFDGRALRAQLNDLADLIRKEARGEDVKGDVAAWYALTDICPTCQSWSEHCYCDRRAA